LSASSGSAAGGTFHQVADLDGDPLRDESEAILRVLPGHRPELAEDRHQDGRQHPVL
jgi:hypothetical protein